MEINNKNNDFKKHPPQQHQIIFFNNAPQQNLNRHQSNEVYDEQEMPLNNADDEDIDEMESYTPVQKKLFTVEKTSNNLSSQYQAPSRRAELHQSSIGMRHPLNSSELFNAFTKENQRENKTMMNINKSQWTDNSSHTPNSLRTDFSRVQNQTYMGGMTNKKLEQSHFLDQKKSNARNFFANNKQNSKGIDEFNDMNYDQEYHMTDQDFDGHDDQQVQDEELFDNQDQDLDDQLPEHDENEEDVKSQEDEGNIPESSNSASPDDHIVSKKNINPNPNQIEYFSNIIEENEEENRESNLRSSNQTTQKSSASALFQQKVNNNVIVERNDRFVVYKMIPQANSTSATKQSHVSLKDQPTPTISDRNNQIKNIQSNKFYSETVEDIQSSDSENNHDNVSYSFQQANQQYRVNLDKNEEFSSPTHHLINLADDSLYEETRLLTNHFVQTQSQFSKKLEKPPINKKSEQATPNIESNQKSFNREKIVSPHNQIDSGKTQIDSTSKNRNVQKLHGPSFEDAKKSLDNDFKLQKMQKSLTANSRTSSDKFNRLQKLEKKNITEENQDRTMEFNNILNNQQNNMIQYSQGPVSQHDNFLLQTQEIVEPIKLNERRQSDSAVLQKSQFQGNKQKKVSQNYRQNQLEQIKMEKQLQNINISTQNTNTQLTHSTIDNQNPKSQLNNDLLEQYRQLKKEMNNQNRTKKPQPKDGVKKNQNVLSTNNKQQVQSKQNLISQHKHQTSNNQSQYQNKRQHEIMNEQAKKKQKMNENDESIYKQQFKSGNLMSSYLSDGNEEDSVKTGNNKISGLLSVQQSTKAKDGRNKKLFIGNNDQNTRTVQQKDRKQSKGKIHQKISPIRDNNQNIKNQKKLMVQKSNKRKENNSSEEYYDSRDNSSQSSEEKNQIKRKQKQLQVNKQQNVKLHGKQPTIIEKRKHRAQQESDDSQSDEYYDEEEHSQDDSHSDYNSRSYTGAGYQSKSYRHQNRSSDEDQENHNRKRKYENESEEYDENQEISDYSKSDQDSSDEYTQSENSDDSRYKSSPEYNNYNKNRIDHSQNTRVKNQNKHKSQSRQRQITKTVKQGDRKLKININMHGEKFNKKQQNQTQNAQEDFLIKQRQILQQQQLMMQMAQYPQQQFLMQQQLALQQQMLLNPLTSPPLQPQIAQQTYFNPQNIQSTMNLGIGTGGFTTGNTHQAQQQNTYDPMQIQSQRYLQINPQKSNILNQTPHSNNISQLHSQHSMIIEESQTNRNLKRNISGKNLKQEGYQKNANFGLNDSISPKRDQIQSSFAPQTNKIYNNPMLQARSPREISANQSFMRGEEDFNQFEQNQQYHNQSISQQKYLHQIKNRFKTGGGTNPHVEQPQYDFEDNQQSFNQMSSRNNKIIPNKSSPLQRMGQEQWREGYQQERQSERNYNLNQRFEEARNFQMNENRNLDYSMNIKNNQNQYTQKHTRTDSYLDNYRERDYKQAYDNEELEDHYEEQRSKLDHNNNRQHYDDIEQQVEELQAPNLMWKRTGDFGAANKKSDNTTPRPVREEIFDNNNKANRSPSGDQRDLSVDEGVKASITRESMHMSPKNEDIDSKNQQIQKNNRFMKGPQPSNLNAENKQADRPSLIKQQSQKNDHKKGAESLWIGFDDDNQIKDPFQNKPALKARDKTQEQILRSKSSKPFESTQNSIAQTAGVQRRVPFQRQKDRQQDQQIGSPIRKDDEIKLTKQTPNLNVPKKSPVFEESPLKKAVKDIQVKVQGKIQVESSKQTNNQADEEEDLKDPNHNKQIVIEIFDKKQGSLPQKEVSLAEMFKAKRKEAIVKQEPQMKQQDQDLQVATTNQDLQQDKPIRKIEKSKEELAELRKKMMKSKVKRKDGNFANNPAGGQDGNMIGQLSTAQDAKNKKKEANEELMLRLALGKKVQVDQKEMKKLTNKNYSNLPEIKKKKEEEQKRLENAARKAAAAEYMKQFNEKRKQMLKKKKSNLNDQGDDE